MCRSPRRECQKPSPCLCCKACAIIYFFISPLRNCIMGKSVEIPQDIIDNVIAAVGDDKRLLKQCALVSSSFLHPCRKLLFSKITLNSDEICQGIYEFLVHNPIIQSFVRTITLDPFFESREWVTRNDTSLLGVLRLPFSRLECFSIGNDVYRPWDWNRFSSELKDAFLNITHSSNLKILSLIEITNIPITFFLHIVHLTTLELYCSLPLNDFGNDENSSPMTWAVSKGVASHMVPVVDRLEWFLRKEDHSKYHVRGTRFPLSTNFSLI